MNKIGIVLIVLSIALLCVASAQGAHISVDPAYINVTPGDTFMVNITADPDDSEVFGIQYIMYFDNILLKPLSQNQGTFLRQDGASANVFKNKINLSGQIEYGETRTDTEVGIKTPGILTTIEFEAKRSGIVDLNFSSVKISDPSSDPITNISISNSTIEISSQPLRPFLIQGHIFYENNSECNNPTVNITNVDTGGEWTAETIESSNYYQIMLASSADITVGK
ncbi:MAG: cohesin domain-containing protein, partial [Methanosarcinaceae archaeon]